MLEPERYMAESTSLSLTSSNFLKVVIGVIGPKDMMMMYGSTIFMIQVTNKKIIDERLWYAPWLVKGLHGSMAGLATSGTLTHWFRDNFAKEIPKDKAFEILAAEAAEAPPGAKGLIVLPYFSGERTPIHDPKARGTIFGLDLTHNRADIFRAFLEGIAMGTAHVFDTYEECDLACIYSCELTGNPNDELGAYAQIIKDNKNTDINNNFLNIKKLFQY